jgi:hypothetical protein
MIKTKRICAGLYEYKDHRDRLWIIEHVTKAEGFSCDEWHYGTENDSHASQCVTKRECIEGLEWFFEYEERTGSILGVTYHE